MKPAFYFLAVLLFLGAGCERREVYPASDDCIANLRQIEGAKEAWAIENHKSTNDTPQMRDITPFLHDSRPCPSGGVYTLGRIGEKPKCSTKGHELP